MKPLLLGVALVLALLLGVGIGYYLSPANSVPASLFGASQEIQSACNYVASNYNATVGLIGATSSIGPYFLYSDNYLATLVLPKDCNNPSLANDITVRMVLSQTSASKIPNQYMVLTCLLNYPPFQGSMNYSLSDNIWTTVNNQTGAPLNDSYADIAFLQAYYDAECIHNVPAALVAFEKGAHEINGIGFNDTPFRVGGSAGIYQTYKLALYVYTAGLLDQTVPLSALVNMMRMQASSGGFYTGYVANLSTDGTSTNTETTCLTIMALEVAFPTTTTTQSVPTWAYLTMAFLFLSGLVVGYTIKKPSISKPADHPAPSKSLVHQYKQG